MPKMRGDELAPQLLQYFPYAKVLYFTAHSDRLFDGRSALWESDAFIDKPVTMNGLLEAVSMSLFGHTTISDLRAHTLKRIEDRQNANAIIVF